MSYEAWGDDDDGLDGVRESYRKTLLEDGWLNDEQAVLVTADAKRYRWLCANGRYRADWWGRFGTPEELSAAIDKAIDKDTTSALSANSPATKGTGVTPASDNAKPPAAKRALLHTDAFCPRCGHNRDKSAVSSIDCEDGTKYCQMCSATWIEMGDGEEAGIPEIWQCQSCGKEFDRKTFSHSRTEADLRGNPVEVECGPISKRETA